MKTLRAKGVFWIFREGWKPAIQTGQVIVGEWRFSSILSNVAMARTDLFWLLSPLSTLATSTFN